MLFSIPNSISNNRSISRCKRSWDEEQKRKKTIARRIFYDTSKLTDDHSNTATGANSPWIEWKTRITRGHEFITWETWNMTIVNDFVVNFNAETKTILFTDFSVDSLCPCICANVHVAFCFSLCFIIPLPMCH